MSQTFKEKITKLVNDLNNNKESQNDCLLEMKTLLITANCDQIQEVVQSLNINHFISQLNSLTNESNTDLIISIFGSILESLPPTYVLTNFQNEINNGLKSKNESIIELWLKTMNRCVNDELTLNNMINTNVNIHSILSQVIRLLSNSNISIAKYCNSILLEIAKSNAINSMFFDKDIQKELIEIKKVDVIVKMRVYELLVSIANTSQMSLYRVESFDHFKHLFNDFNEDIKKDPLIGLNFLQILTDLGSTPFGTKYLQTSDILKTLVDRFVNNGNDIFAQLLIPGFVKIFGTLGYNEPKILNEYPIVRKKLMSLLDESDISLKLCSIEAIARICSINEGKKVIDEEQNMGLIFMTTVGSLLTNSNTDVKTRSLTSLAIVLQVTEPDPSGDITTFTHKWFKLLLPDRALSALLNLCREPFMEIRLSALECIRVLAASVWGQKELAAFPGFLEYILDRKTETTKYGKEAKYAIIRELVVSPFITLCFTEEAIQQLRTYNKSGPFHVEPQTAVAFESN